MTELIRDRAEKYLFSQYRAKGICTEIVKQFTINAVVLDGLVLSTL